MKSIFLSSVFLISLFYSGCSQKAPEVEPVVINKNTPTQVEQSSSMDAIGENAINGGSIDDTVGQLQTVNESSSVIGLEGENSGLEPVYFAFDKFTLSDEELDKATNNARKIESEGINKVRLEGNCDEWGSDEYNFALGLKRAKSVKEVLVANNISSSKIFIISNGESKPVCTEHNDACWQKNRRVDFKLLNQ